MNFITWLEYTFGHVFVFLRDNPVGGYTLFDIFLSLALLVPVVHMLFGAVTKND